MYKWKNRNKKYKLTILIRMSRLGYVAKRRNKKYKIIWVKTRWKWSGSKLTEDKGIQLPIEVE